MYTMQGDRKIRRQSSMFPLRRQRINLTMSNIGNKIRNSLLKRQEANDKFKARKDSFLLAKEQITKDIEEAGNIWRNTLKQLPKREFN